MEKFRSSRRRLSKLLKKTTDLCNIKFNLIINFDNQYNFIANRSKTNAFIFKKSYFSK